MSLGTKFSPSKEVLALLSREKERELASSTGNGNKFSQSYEEIKERLKGATLTLKQPNTAVDNSLSKEVNDVDHQQQQQQQQSDSKENMDKRATKQRERMKLLEYDKAHLLHEVENLRSKLMDVQRNFVESSVKLKDMTEERDKLLRDLKESKIAVLEEQEWFNDIRAQFSKSQQDRDVLQEKLTRLETEAESSSEILNQIQLELKQAQLELKKSQNSLNTHTITRNKREQEFEETVENLKTELQSSFTELSKLRVTNLELSNALQKADRDIVELTDVGNAIESKANYLEKENSNLKQEQIKSSSQTKETLDGLNNENQKLLENFIQSEKKLREAEARKEELAKEKDNILWSKNEIEKERDILKERVTEVAKDQRNLQQSWRERERMLHEEISSKNTRLEVVETALDAAREQSSRVSRDAENKIKELKTKVDEITLEKDRLRNQLTKVEDELRIVLGRKDTLEKEIAKTTDDFSKRQERHQQEMKDVIKENEMLFQQALRIRDEFQRLASEHNRIIDSKDKELEVYRENVSMLQKERENLRSEIEGFIETHKNQQKSNQDSQKTIEALTKNNTELTEKLSELNKKKSELEKILDNSNTIIESLRKKVSEQDQTLSVIVSEIKNLSLREEEIERQKKKFEEERVEKEGQVKRLELITNELQGLLDTSTSALVDTTNQYENTRRILQIRDSEVHTLTTQIDDLTHETDVLKSKLSGALETQKFQQKALEEQMEVERERLNVINETERVFSEMRAELEKTHLALRDEQGKRMEEVGLLRSILDSMLQNGTGTVMGITNMLKEFGIQNAHFNQNHHSPSSSNYLDRNKHPTR